MPNGSAGTSGQVLTSQGTGNPPQWTTITFTETDPLYSSWIDATGSTSNQILRFNGTKYVPTSTGALTTTTNGVTITGGSNAVLGSGTTIDVATANGTQTGLLTNTDWTTFNNKENVLTFNSPLSRAGNTISLPQASGSSNGYLSSIDWTSFNNRWSLSGNSLSGTEKFGSTNDQPVRFITNNTERFRFTTKGQIEVLNSAQSVFLGERAGAYQNNDMNRYNVFVGYEAGYSNTTGGYNTACGYVALRSNTGGIYNTAIGYYSLYYTTTGTNNTGLGAYALYSNTEGFDNVALGTWALYSNTVGYQNDAFGHYALYSNTTGCRNIAIGQQALYTQSYNNGGSTWNSDNVAVGYKALYSNQPTNTSNGIQNTAVGNYALYSNTTGNLNTSIGFKSLYYNTTGYNNTAIGNFALNSNINANNNTAIGASSLVFNTYGHSNTASGASSLAYNSTGSYNTASGASSLIYNSTGSYNVALGHNAGFGSSGVNFNQCTFVGANSYPTTSRTNVTMLGYGITDAECTGDNQVLLGNTSITQIRAQVGTITTYSDGRYKTNVKEDVHGLDFVMKLRPVTFNKDPRKLHQIWGTPDSIVAKMDVTEVLNQRHIGLIAQEVDDALKECGWENFPGIDRPRNEKEVYTLRYGDFILPMIKSIQEQQKMIEEQSQTIEELKKENEELRQRLEQLERIVLQGLGGGKENIGSR